MATIEKIEMINGLLPFLKLLGDGDTIENWVEFSISEDNGKTWRCSLTSTLSDLSRNVINGTLYRYDAPQYRRFNDVKEFNIARKGRGIKHKQSNHTHYALQLYENGAVYPVCFNGEWSSLDWIFEKCLFVNDDLTTEICGARV